MKEKTYLISAVASKYNIHPQTLRLYEREGLLIPSRTEGNTRVYKEKDLKKLESILNLSREMGVNLAGIEIILNMKDKMESMRLEIIDLKAKLDEKAEAMVKLEVELEATRQELEAAETQLEETRQELMATRETKLSA